MQQHFSGGGQIYSTRPDDLSFIRMLMLGGSLDGVRILDPDTVTLMVKNEIGKIEAGDLRTTAPAYPMMSIYFLASPSNGVLPT